MALIEKLDAIGDAVRGKTGGTEKLTLDAIATAISELSSGGELKYLKVTPTLENGTHSFTNANLPTSGKMIWFQWGRTYNSSSKTNKIGISINLISPSHISTTGNSLTLIEYTIDIDLINTRYDYQTQTCYYYNGGRTDGNMLFIWCE